MSDDRADKEDNDFISRSELCTTLHDLAGKFIDRRETKNALLILDIMHAFWPKPEPLPDPDYANLPLRDPNAPGPRCNYTTVDLRINGYMPCTRSLDHDGPCAHTKW